MSAYLTDLQAARNLAGDMRDLIKEGLLSVYTFESRGGEIKDCANGYRARLSGFTATCTGSASGAVYNWLVQVENKAMAAGLTRQTHASQTHASQTHERHTQS